MPESVAEMPKVDDTISEPKPGESPEEYKKRLDMLKAMAQGTYREDLPEDLKGLDEKK
ncbi:hypothetical protein HY732_02485 [Candidatus Uhrbacteria bacterium]|nr:hypothetical protein [Candidatus Uhrbacteria bacterium]